MTMTVLDVYHNYDDSGISGGSCTIRVMATGIVMTKIMIVIMVMATAMLYDFV